MTDGGAQLGDAIIELGDLGFEEVDVRQDVGDQQPVMLAAEPARQRLDQLVASVLEPPLRQPGQHDRVGLPAGERGQDLAGGLGLRCRYHRRQLDRRVLEDLVEALDLA